MGLGLLLESLCSGEGVSGKHDQFSDASVHFDGPIQSRAARVPGNHCVTCSAEIPDVHVQLVFQTFMTVSAQLFFIDVR